MVEAIRMCPRHGEKPLLRANRLPQISLPTKRRGSSLGAAAWPTQTEEGGQEEGGRERRERGERDRGKTKRKVLKGSQSMDQGELRGTFYPSRLLTYASIFRDGKEPHITSSSLEGLRKAEARWYAGKHAEVNLVGEQQASRMVTG